MNKLNIIQIGCNVCNDTVTEIIKNNQIKTFVAVDAEYRCIEIAKEVYSFLGDRLIPICTAIGLKNGVTSFFVPKKNPLCGHASLSKEHLEKHDHVDIDQITVPILNVNTFLESINLESIDLLYIDTEGFDAPILLELDFKKFKPNQIIYEFMHSDGKHTVGENHQKLMNKFIENEYSVYQISPENILAKKNI